MNTKVLNRITKEIDDFSGLVHIGDGKNKDIENYFQSFLTWIEWNHVLEVVNNYQNVHMTLQYVTSHDFLVWLLHYGDVYDNLLRHCLASDSHLDYRSAAKQLYELRQLHPKFSFTVALSARISGHAFLSDNDLDKLIPVLAAIPNNKSKKVSERIQSDYGDGLYDALYSLSNFAVERVSQDCF